MRGKERRALQAEALQGRTQAACQRLQGDIQGLKTQKVALQKQAEASSKAFAAWRKDREREMATLRRQVSTLQSWSRGWGQLAASGLLCHAGMRSCSSS